MLSRDDAVALVTASRLFDDAWFAALVGETFDSRAEAASRWVDLAGGPDDLAPHPLVEPAWLYPGGRWRRDAPDPLSFLLTRAAARGRSPHPCYPQGRLGPLADWLAEHDPCELLPAPVPRAEPGPVAVVTGGELGSVVTWVRYLAAAGVDVRIDDTGLSAGARRVVDAVVATLPRARRGPADADVVVSLDAGLGAPPWPADAWLPALLATLDRPGVAAAQPVLLRAEELTVAAPALPGHPVSAIERLDGTPLADRFPGAEARRTGAAGERVLATSSWLVGDPGPAGEQAELTAAARPAVEGLRWAIDVAAGAAPIGRRWGDWHFARSLADALERLGQWVEIDHPETRGRATRLAPATRPDVTLVLRGLEPLPPQPGTRSLVWVISHPDTVAPTELAGFDVAFAAGTAWAQEHGARPLLQCTDATRFHPGVGIPADDGPALFVGNARGGPRPVVSAALEAGVPLRVVGTGWAAHGVDAAADRIANTDLPAAYAGAPVVLNDHHPDMRRLGFVSNRVFDVLAVGGRLVTDDVAGLAEALGVDVDLPVWRTAADVARLASPPFTDHPDAAARTALAEHVVAHHSFDARARTLLDAALALPGG